MTSAHGPVHDFAARLTADLPGAVSCDRYLTATVGALAPLGFTPGAALPLVGVCRDELTAPFLVGVRDRWGNPFLLGGLAGQISLGRTGLSAAAGHAPSPDPGGPDRFVAYLLPHIGIDADGQIGWTVRPGQPERSTACGALVALSSTLGSALGAPGGPAPGEMDAGDLEQSILAGKVRAALGDREVPDLLGLTELVGELLVADFLATLHATAAAVPRLAEAKVAVLSGLLVHGPGGRDHVAPRQAFVVAGDGEGAREPITGLAASAPSGANGANGR